MGECATHLVGFSTQQGREMLQFFSHSASEGTHSGPTATCPKSRNKEAAGAGSKSVFV